jgi:2-polyprenyl-3-methyl-5-hydroxy-6-metoxy-1,4-benzoquinol methylase
MRHRLPHAPELLDEESHDPKVLAQSLSHVAQVNRFLGGYRAGIAAVRPLFSAGRTVRILDVGTATADIPRAIVDAARSAGATVEVIATDLHPQMRDLAVQRSRDYPEIRIEAADAFALPYDEHSFDIALMSMTLHHFEDDAPVAAVRECARVARVVVVNDLERGWMNYAGARLLAATWWRGNILTRHDGPLSVLRAFTATELRDIAIRAGLRNVRVQRRWFFRLLMTGESPS